MFLGKEDFIRQFESYAEDFDAEEHAEMWIEGRGKNGVPDSIKDLLEDAEWQKEMLLEVAKELSGKETETEKKNLIKVICPNCGKPLKKEGFDMFDELVERIQRTTISVLRSLSTIN